MHAELRQQAVDLRVKDRLSYLAICKKLGVAKSTLSYWLREYPLSKEEINKLQKINWQQNEVRIERFRVRMREKRAEKEKIVYQKYTKQFLNLKRESFFIAGLMLYLAEGGKTHTSNITIANTDVRLIKFFMKWVQEFLGFRKSELRAMLHLYENMDIAKEQKFWKNELGLSSSQFYKSQIRKLRKSSFSYKSSFRHGTCQIYAQGVEKKRELMMAIQAMLDQYQKMQT